MRREKDREREGVRIRMRAGGGAVEGRFCKSAGGRLNAKLPRNRIFVFLVVEYFEAWGLCGRKMNGFTVAEGLHWTQNRITDKRKGLFEKFHALVAGAWLLDPRNPRVTERRRRSSTPWPPQSMLNIEVWIACGRFAFPLILQHTPVDFF
jgi:hypothetical protein